ncbi:portal protein, partial [Arthrospira platensis SPKY1]|nr:portal protein [Arthrospira platensis SPKY1]
MASFGYGSFTDLRLNPDGVCYVHSGISNKFNTSVLSYLHKAIKSINQLKMMEDSSVIYRITRAPERRIFKIDIGNLPKSRADEYMKSVMQNYRNKLIYDGETGEIRNDKRFLSMLEDFWIPVRST